MTPDPDPIPALLARLDALEKKATPGPWGWYNAWGPHTDGLMRALYLGRQPDAERVLGDSMFTGDVAARTEDMELLAELRNAYPALRAEIERLRRELSRLILDVREAEVAASAKVPPFNQAEIARLRAVAEATRDEMGNCYTKPSGEIVRLPDIGGQLNMGTQ
jgi:hypothetical protein